MKARLQDYRTLWRAAVSQSNAWSTRFIQASVWLTVLMLGAGMALTDGPRTAIAFLWSAVFVILLLNWGWRFMPGAVKLNSPANAKLVPQMRARLVELSCIVCIAGIAGIASAPHADSTLLVGALFWTVLITLGTGLAAAGHPAGSPIVTAGMFCAVFAGKLTATLSSVLSHPIVILLSLPLYAGAIVVAVRAMFPQGGERHWNMEARRARWGDAAGKRDPFVERVAAVHTKGWYAASLRRDCVRRDGRRLLLHALGPKHHLGEMAVATCLLAVVLAVLGIFMGWKAGLDTVRGIGWLFAALLLFVPLSHSLRLGQLAGSHPAEQSLARLAPAAPASSAAFNRQLGRSLLLRALAGWLMASSLGLLLMALGGAGASTLLLLAGVCCLALPMVALPLRDHAARRKQSGIVGILLVLLSFASCLVLATMTGRIMGLPVMLVAVFLGIAVTVLAVVRGLRTMEAAPCAFPAGRMD
ncbi:hypothetical protein [Massilia sp. 9I]|uniref:hypothetical protein n=1 Tax=Massilia sp. 9I TaxID=2653152 RepID=UPI0012F0EAC3|nr:hypothetical protein [Massilia sp. 9I]VXB45792.1 conserved membrane hypothetical protein [Massilia sp. 9I]